MSIVKKLVSLLENEYNIYLDNLSFKRTYCGYWQRAMGAWSWTMRYKKNNPCDFGSQESISYILKNKERIVIYNNEIIIENEKAD